MTNPPAPPNPPQPAALDLESLAAQARESAGSKDRSEAQPVDPGQAPAEPGTDKVVLKVGGVDQTFTHEELAEIASRGSSLDGQQAALNDGLANLGRQNALAQQFQAMTPEQQQHALAVIANPGGFGSPPDAGDDPFLESVHGNGAPASSGKSDDLAAEVSRLKAAMGEVAQVFQAQDQEKYQAGLGDQVETMMNAFPVFAADSSTPAIAKTARGPAKESIMRELALSPNTPLRELIAGHAATTQQIVDAAQESVLPRSNHGVTVDGGVFRPTVAQTATDFTSGGTAKLLEDFVAARQAR